MNISIYMNDGSEVSSIDIQDATSEEALTAIRAFGFGGNGEKEEWIYSDNQKIRYKVEDSDQIRIKELTENYEKLKKTDEILRMHCTYYKTRYREFLKQLDAVEKDRVELKEKYETLQKERDEIIEERDKIFNELMEWKEMYKLECQRNEEIKTTKDFNSLVIKFGEENYHLDELMAENDNLKKENEELKKTIEALKVHSGYYEAQYNSCLKNNDILEDAVNEWKEKYAIECQHNDEIKKAYDVLTKNFKALMNNRDEWIDESNMFEKAYRSADTRCLELCRERDNLKAEYEKIRDERDNLIEERDLQDGLCSL